MAETTDNRRTPQMSRFLDSFQESVGMSDETRQSLDTGSDHPYQCRCDECLNWWAHMGAEDGGDGRFSYGPFSEREVKARQKELDLL